MNRFLATTATAALLAFGPAAFAQETTAPEATAPETAAPAGGAEGFMQAHSEGDVYASDLIGMDIYASADEVDATQPATEDMRAGWEDIGEVNDILVSAEGQVEAVLVDVGGFLGMGEHTIAVQMDRVNLMTDESGARFAAIMATRESLELAPEFERPDAMAPAGDTMGAAPGVTTGVTPPATDSTAADTTAVAPPGTMAADDTAAEPTGEGEMAADPEMAAGEFTPPEGYAGLAAEELTAERLDGATIYGQGDETIGTISELVIDTSGKITQAVVDVGGFLGMGAHTVALDFEQLNVVHNAETDEVRVYSSATKEELEQMPEHEG
jgi:sporulation protein YlmC with PRC-barrel domain